MPTRSTSRSTSIPSTAASCPAPAGEYGRDRTEAGVEGCRRGLHLVLRRFHRLRLRARHRLENTAEIALELAWKDADAVYISFDVDSIDCGFVPGTGWRIRPRSHWSWRGRMPTRSTSRSTSIPSTAASCPA